MTPIEAAAKAAYEYQVEHFPGLIPWPSWEDLSPHGKEVWLQTVESAFEAYNLAVALCN